MMPLYLAASVTGSRGADGKGRRYLIGPPPLLLPLRRAYGVEAVPIWFPVHQVKGAGEVSARVAIAHREDHRRRRAGAIFVECEPVNRVLGTWWRYVLNKERATAVLR